MELVDEAKFGASGGGLLLVGERHAIATGDDDLARIRGFKKPGDMEQRRLART